MILSNFFRGKKVLITGHTGFKGSWLSQALLLWGADITGVSLVPETNPSLHFLLKHQHEFRNYYSDIRDHLNLLSIIKTEKPEIIFHLAAQPLVRRGYREPLQTFCTNIQGTANLLDIVREVSCVKSVVIVMTDKVYQDKNWVFPYREIDPLGGHDPYSASKAAADIVAQSYIQSFFSPETYLKNHSTLVTIGRAGNVIGGGDWSEDRLVPDIVKATFEKNIPVVLRYPNAVRPWEHVLESLSGYLLLAKRAYEGDISVSQAWNFGPEADSFVSVEVLARSFISRLKTGSVVIDPGANLHETMVLKLDTNKSKTQLGWKSRWSFPETVQKTVDWYATYYKDGKIKDITEQQINLFFA